MAYVDRSHFPVLPVDFMNADHEEEFRLLEQVGDALEAQGAGAAGEALVLERLALLAVHSRENFLREEIAMRAARFPDTEAHRAEHDKALAEMDAEVRRFRETGDRERLREYLLDAVPSWFETHIGTTDLLAARFLAAQSVPGAQPSP